MSEPEQSRPIEDVKRELGLALRALDEPGAGARGTQECRIADLQGRLLASPARSLADVEAKLDVIRSVVEGLGPRGYLLDLVSSTLADVRRLRQAEAADKHGMTCPTGGQSPLG